MKKDQYFPHEVSTRSNSQMMNLIEKEGMTGYGAYWALMEYLRSQDDYIGDVRTLKNLARQIKISADRLLRILNNYGLFVITDFTFRSQKLETMMKPLEKKRKAMNKCSDAILEATVEQSLDDQSMTKQRNPRNPLETNGDISLSKVKKSKVKKSKVSSSKEEGDDGVAPIPMTLAWERYVDELQHEQHWIEIMAMRSGMGKTFEQRFGEILGHFKRHVQALGSEKEILSPSDAKRYFCFYNTPGSVPFLKLMEYLKQTEIVDPYRFEDRDPVTGERSYCGVPIPEDAPPRPNDQAVWCNGKWVY